MNVAFIAAFALLLGVCGSAHAQPKEFDPVVPVRCKPVQPKVTEEQVDAVWATIRAWECK